LNTAPAKKTPLLSKNLYLFLFAMVLANIGGSMYGPLLPLYLQDLGAAITQIGLFFTLSMIIPLALQILGGWVSDSVGRLRAIAFGSLAGCLAYIALILAPTWGWLLLASGLMSIGTSLVGPSFDAFIAENSDEANRARVFGISGALFTIVSVIGPLMGGYMAEEWGFKVMLGLAAVLYFAATIIRIGMARRAAKNQEANPTKLSLAGLKGNLGIMLGMLLAGGVVTWILITDGVRDISFSLSFNLIPVYMEEIGGLSLKQIGLVNSVFGVCLMLTAFPAGWLADHRGERVGIVLSFFIMAAALAVLIYMPAQLLWYYLLSWALFGVGVGLADPAYKSLISKAIPKHVRGTAYGLFSTSLGLVSLPAPWIGSQLWARFGPRVPFQITLIVTLLSTIPAWFKFKLPEKTEEQSAVAQAD
jgi:MFS family permease